MHKFRRRLGQWLGWWYHPWATDKKKLRRRLKVRMQQWRRAPTSSRLQFLANLTDKSTMREFISSRNIPLPHQYFETSLVDEIDFASLPDRFVVKPANASSSRAVMLFADGVELFSNDRVPREAVANYVSSNIKQVAVDERRKILVEELVEDCDPTCLIPRDFKIYTAGGRVHVIQVIDRNGGKPYTQSFYSREWERLPELQRTYVPGVTYPAPSHLSRLVYYAEQISQELEVFYRLDFYISPSGPVFGEFTSHPFGGRKFSPEGQELCLRLMAQHPDP
jgi:hypothetical protein